MLHFLYDSGPQSVKYIAAHAGTTSSPVTISMKRLERANLVKKIRGKSDERIVTVHLTEQGKKVFEARREERIKILSQLFNSLDLKEKYQLNALLEKVLLSSSPAIELPPTMVRDRKKG
jgi:MarR family transcriptional regulator, organic hydroperoxide resistance regulator